MNLQDFLTAHPKVTTYPPRIDVAAWKPEFVFVFSRASALKDLEDYQYVGYIGSKSEFTMLKRKLNILANTYLTTPGL